MKKIECLGCTVEGIVASGVCVLFMRHTNLQDRIQLYCGTRYIRPTLHKQSLTRIQLSCKLYEMLSTKIANPTVCRLLRQSLALSQRTAPSQALTQLPHESYPCAGNLSWSPAANTWFLLEIGRRLMLLPLQRKWNKFVYFCIDYGLA